MNNEESKFFLHGTTVSNPDMVKDIFNNGLLNYRTNVAANDANRATNNE